MTLSQPYERAPQVINGEQTPTRTDLGSFISGLTVEDQTRFNERVLGKITGEAGLSYDDAVFEVMKTFIPSSKLDSIYRPTPDQLKDFADDTPERAADRAHITEVTRRVAAQRSLAQVATLPHDEVALPDVQLSVE
jgi:hypothetical protein